MTRKQYQMLADLVASLEEPHRTAFATKLASKLKTDNALFDTTRFLRAAGVIV